MKAFYDKYVAPVVGVVQKYPLTSGAVGIALVAFIAGAVIF
jgi:uncharacterized membrane protein